MLDKAVAVLAAVEPGPCTLADLTDRTGLPRATAHRLAAALEWHGLLGRDGRGAWVLGPELVRLGRAAAAPAPLSLVEAAAPHLERLRDRTGESAQLYVRSGSARVCVASLESPHSLRTIVAVGAVLPMDRGSAARALSGVGGPARRGWVQSVEERERGVASVSAAVHRNGAVVAAVSVSGPIERTSRQPGRRYGAAVVEAARDVERSLRPSDRPTA